MSYMKELPIAQECQEERTEVRPRPKPKTRKDKVEKKPKTIVTLPEPKQTVTDTTPQPTEVTPKKDYEVMVQTQYENPQVLTSPLYRTESEINNLDDIQTDEYIDDMVISLETQIVNQKPEVKKKLEEYNIDAEKMAKLVPITTETKDFMMQLDMEGLKLPHLMLLYQNIPQFYDSIRKNTEVDNDQLKPITKVINYNDFWEWTRTLWDRTSEYLINKVSGTIPELGKEFTVLP